MPEFRPGGESSAVRWGRRALVIPAYLLLTPVILAALPILLAAAVLTDLSVRRPLPTVRAVLFAACYLVCESFGVVASFALWLGSGVWAGASRERYLRWNVALQRLWAGLLFAAASGLFRFRLEVEGDHDTWHGPAIVFMRHASVADTLLPAMLLANRHGVRLRYVLKRELLWDPCLDVVGQRLPNVFVRRDAGDTAAELAAVRRVAEGLHADEGVLIYPEGTRFTPEKRQRVLQRLEQASDRTLLPRARALQHVLPPRLGGPLALLDACPDANALFIAHVGFDGMATFGDVWRGNLIGRTIRVNLRHVPAADIPRERDARVAWLYEQWSGIDAWVGAGKGRLVAPAEGRRRARDTAGP